MTETSRSKDLVLYRRLLKEARPYWMHITGIFVLDLISTPLALLYPLPLKIAVDSVLSSEPIPSFLKMVWPEVATRSEAGTLTLVIVLLIGIALLSQFQGLGSGLLRTYTAERLMLDFRSKLFRQVQRLSLLYHDLKGTADSLYRIQWDAAAVQYVAINGVTPFITASFTLVSMLYITSQLDWQLALVAMAVTPVLFLVARIYRLSIRHQARRVKRVESDAFSVVQEVLVALRVVKAFGQEDREQQRFVNQSVEGIQARLRLSLTEGALGLLLGLTTTAGTAIVLFIGVRHVQMGVLTLGELLLVMAYLSQLYGPLRTISRKMASLQGHLASAERAFALLDEAHDVAERPYARPISRATGAITFRNVSFTYDKSQPVLHDISFEVSAGTRVGIAGRTGAGKTTLVSLMMRFYDPMDGQILLDGVDVCDYKLSDLRKQFALVLQETILFSTSIAENIAYARPEASDQEIMEAARAANAHDFVVGLREGYETQVGERGMRLSGGERQRIALARAFLKDAPILILDEPTSSVDIKTETDIMEAMERLMKGRTTFTITHRLSTLENCDVMLVIEDGRLVATKSDVSKIVRAALAGGGIEAVIR